jgi:Leucine-rich repeat (LRR) protein
VRTINQNHFRWLALVSTLAGPIGFVTLVLYLCNKQHQEERKKRAEIVAKARENAARIAAETKDPFQEIRNRAAAVPSVKGRVRRGNVRLPPALKALLRVGATVTVDDSRPDKPPVAVEFSGARGGLFFRREPPLAPWLEDRGKPKGKRVTALTDLTPPTISDRKQAALTLTGPKPGPEDFRRLKTMKTLRWLDFRFTGVTDGEVAALRGHRDLKWISLGGTKITDGCFEGLPRKLETLDVSRTRITDAGLGALADFPTLKQLNLGFTRVTDAGLKKLKALRRLETLSLRGTRVTDKGLRELTELPRLKVLLLGDTKITDQWVPTITKVKGLRRLELAPRVVPVPYQARDRFRELMGKKRKAKRLPSELTDRGLAALTELKDLRWLCLRNADLTDQGLNKLKACRRLEVLDLRGTRITDKGLVELQTLPKLRSLDLRETEITRAAAAEFLKRHPRLRIIR